MKASEAHAFRFAVRLTPKGGRDAIEGWQFDAAGRKMLKARVAAPPEDGKANAALIALLAQALNIGTSRIRVVGGASSRVKTIEAEGNAADLSARLQGTFRA